MIRLSLLLALSFHTLACNVDAAESKTEGYFDGDVFYEFSGLAYVRCLEDSPPSGFTDVSVCLPVISDCFLGAVDVAPSAFSCGADGHWCVHRCGEPIVPRADICSSYGESK